MTLTIPELVPFRLSRMCVSAMGDTGDNNSGLGEDRGAAVSVEGQVDELIRAAVCQQNLAKMHLGWMPQMIRP